MLLKDIKNYEDNKSKKVSKVPGIEESLPDRNPEQQRQELASTFKQQAAASELPVDAPDRLSQADMQRMQDSQRSQYVQSFDKWADAEKAGNISQKEWANERINKMKSLGINPGNYENVVAMLGDAETPDEIAKREKREALGETFRNLGNLIGNAANIYYTHRGGKYIDLNTANEKYRERMQRIKDKQDALREKRNNIFINAQQGDMKSARAEAAAAKQAERNLERDKLRNERDLIKLDIQNAYRLGQLDSQAKDRLERDLANAKSRKELESLRQSGRMALKQTGVSSNKVVDSAIGSDGKIYTRNSKLTDNEAMQIVQSHVDDIDLQNFTTVDKNGNEKINYREAAAYALQKGLVSVDYLKQMGFNTEETKKSVSLLPNSETKKTSGSLLP